ncbi:protein-L-isoaspartate carboxylmethyltransferase [Saccharomonospora phage PIS 136]|nr:protein-L-isoaspartate carboxylmethyltransferase [Saccharomonospora phage PIS 136]
MARDGGTSPERWPTNSLKGSDKLMITTDDTAALRARLADSLPLTSNLWQQAFRTVPRHVFAPRFARRDLTVGEFVHHDVTDPKARKSALAAVYSDDVLVTQFGDDGAATSSSTEPSLMASMLEALDTEPGHNVLEVGTGTGSNAGLLCEALGSDMVTTR